MTDWSNLRDIILNEFPYPVAERYRLMLEATTPEMQAIYGIDVFEFSVRWLTLGLLGQYIHHDLADLNDAVLNEQALSLFKRPASPGTWVKVFFKALDAYKGHKARFFMPELYDFYWDTDVETHRMRRGLQAPFYKLVNLRNRNIGHTRPSSKVEWQKFASEVDENLFEVLSGFQFLQSYDLIHLVAHEEGAYVFDVYTGQQVRRQTGLVTSRVPMEIRWCYLSKVTGELLPVHPLVILWEKQIQEGTRQPEVLIYDAYNESAISYWSSSGRTELDRIIAPYLLDVFVERVVERLKDAYQPQRAIRHLDWLVLKSLAEEIVASRMGDALQKYNPRVYVQRQEFRQLVDRFLQVDETCLILTGATGVGKSNFTVSLLKEFSESQTICALAYDGARLDAAITLEELLAHDFNVHLKLEAQRLPDGPTLMKMIAGVEGIETRQLVLIVDALNENPNPKEVLRLIDRFIDNYPFPWLKVIVTCRPETWRNLRVGVRLAEHKYFRLEGTDSIESELLGFSEKPSDLSERSELQQAYEKYRQAYGLATDFPAIPSRIKLLLQNPLTLWLVAETYEHGPIPEDIRTSELIARYIEKLKDTNRLEERDLHFLRVEIVPRLFSPPYRTRLTQREIEKEIASNGSPLFEYIFNDDQLPGGRRVNQSYTNLVDGGFLSRQRTAESFNVSFKYERFFDFFGGRRILQLAEDTEGPRTQFYLNWIRSTVENPFLWGSVHEAILLDARQGNVQPIIDLAQTTEQSVKDMIIAVLRSYGRENVAAVKLILQQLISLTQESKPGLRKRLLSWEDIDLSIERLNAGKVAVEVAGDIADLDVLELAGASRSQTVRVSAVRQILRLWRTDRATTLHSRQHYGSLVVVQGLVNRIEQRYIPNKHAMETSAVVMLYILSEVYDDLSQGQDPELAQELRQIARKGIAALLGIVNDKEPKPARFRALMLSLLVKATLTWTDDTPKHNTVGSRNLQTYFDLSKSDKEVMLSILPYLNPENKNLDGLEKNLQRIIDLNDTIITYTLRFVLIAQWDSNRSGVMKICRMLLEAGNKEVVPSYAIAVPLAALGNILEQGRGDSQTAALFLEGYSAGLDSTRGRVRFSGSTYVNSGLDIYLRAMHGFQGYVDTSNSSILMKHVNRAIQEDDVEFLDSIIYNAGFMFQDRCFHEPLFRLLSPIISYNNEVVQKLLVNLLGRMFQYYPNEVEDFLLANGASDELLHRVRYAEVIASIGGDYLSDRLNGFMADSAARSPKMQQAMAYVMRYGTDCDSLAQFIHNILETIINLAYDDLVFDHQSNYLLKP